MIPVIQYSYLSDAKKRLGRQCKWIFKWMLYLMGKWKSLSKPHLFLKMWKEAQHWHVPFLYPHRIVFIDCGILKLSHCREPHQWNDCIILFIVNINCCAGGGCATHWGLFTWVVYESSSVFAESHTKAFLLFTYTIGHPCDNKSLFRCNWNDCEGVKTHHQLPPLVSLTFVLYEYNSQLVLIR